MDDTHTNTHIYKACKQRRTFVACPASVSKIGNVCPIFRRVRKTAKSDC
jgi:hypothetical protein